MFTTTKRKRLFGFTKPALAFAFALTAASGFAQEPASSRTQEVSELTLADQELLFRLSQQFAEATELFEDPQRQSQSIDFLGQVIDEIEQERRMRDDLPDEIVNLQQQALELRARAYFNADQIPGATDDFRQLLLDNPRYSLDAEALSPKVVDFFEDQKKQLIGYIAVTTEPAGARVMVNGNFIGITNFFPIEVHTGMARIEITLEGHSSYVDTSLRIEPGEVTPLDLVLERTSASLPIITDPPGAEIVVDGEVVGRTSGTLPFDLRSFMPAEFDPNRLSAPFTLGALPLGRHNIELRMECYQPVRFNFNAEQPRDYTAQIHKLEESVGQLNISSNPTGGRVFIDGESRGTTPLTLDRVCSGPHLLEVKHATGKYVEDIEVGANESLSFECPIRPTLAFLGVTADDGVVARDRSDIRSKILSELPKLQRMNLVIPEEDELSRALAGAAVTDFVPALSSGEGSADRIRELSERIGEVLEVEALLVGYVPAQRLTKDVVLHFLAVGAGRPDAYELNYLDPMAMPAFVEELSSPTELFGTWAGLTAVDTRLMDGPIVLALSEDGPAATSGFQPGDVIVSVGGNPVTQALDLISAVRDSEPGAQLPVSVMRGAQATEVSLSVGTTPKEVPLKDPNFLYNKAIVDLRHRMVVEPTLEPLARLNAGLCSMAIGDFEMALKEYLPRVNLSETKGISQGTVYYYTALAYLELGEREEAARIFQQALGFEEATLQSNDGPRVAPLAERRLRELGY